MPKLSTHAAPVVTEPSHVCECIECRKSFTHDQPVDICDACYTRNPGDMTPDEWQEHERMIDMQYDTDYLIGAMI